MSDYNNILVALDLVGNEEYLIESALKVASGIATIKLIHVYEATMYPSDAYMGSFPIDVRENEIAKIQLQFAELVEKYSLTKEDHRAVVGRAASEIHRAAEESAVDLIVVGSHGRHGIQLLLGSTANAVLHGAKCDVLAVRMREKE